MKQSPRLKMYAKNWTDAEMDALISRPAVCVELIGKDFTSQSEVLANALRNVFLPDQQIRTILRELVSLARGHAQTHFDTDEKYLSGLYSSSPWGSRTSPAICFTGLAGVGKSEILAALARLLAGTDTYCVPGHTGLPLEAIWSMTLAGGLGLNQILKRFVQPKNASTAALADESALPASVDAKGFRLTRLLELGARMSWRGGTCIGTIDEFQRIATSERANALATTVLVRLLGIGPLLIYCPNYSLVHKLKARKQEDRQRLLSRRIVVNPPPCGSDNWIAYLGAVKSVAPKVLCFDLKGDAEEIHRYTYGLKRLVVELVVIAFRIAKSKSANGTVGGAELLAAYQSADYCMNREDVEALHTQAITGKMVRLDLWCPFESTAMSHTVEPLTAAVSSFESRVEDALLAAAMLPDELAAVKVLAPTDAKKDAKANVLRFPRGKATREGLLAGADALASIK